MNKLFVLVTALLISIGVQVPAHAEPIDPELCQYLDDCQEGGSSPGLGNDDALCAMGKEHPSCSEGKEEESIEPVLYEPEFVPVSIKYQTPDGWVTKDL